MLGPSKPSQVLPLFLAVYFTAVQAFTIAKDNKYPALVDVKLPIHFLIGLLREAFKAPGHTAKVIFCPGGRHFDNVKNDKANGTFFYVRRSEIHA